MRIDRMTLDRSETVCTWRTASEGGPYMGFVRKEAKEARFSCAGGFAWLS
jgi:hypothetical protein